MSTTIYYPRIESLNFYDTDGIVCGGITGSMAVSKFHRMIREGKWPRISLRKHIRVALRGGAR